MTAGLAVKNKKVHNNHLKCVPPLKRPELQFKQNLAALVCFLAVLKPDGAPQGPEPINPSAPPRAPNAATSAEVPNDIMAPGLGCGGIASP